MKRLTLGSLFDGIGGFPLAAQRCGIKTLWASEIETACVSITKRHFPHVQHLGDITKIDGAEIPPVDIISFGSPCQDLSVAGGQKGLRGERSGLFLHAVRIINEMRYATNGKYPTYIIWENVPGAFNSSGGADFKAVIETLTKTRIPMPNSGRWATAGMAGGGRGGANIAWRQFDSQYWGIPQRRKRIFLVGDFRGNRAAEILFKPDSLLGYVEAGRKPGEGIAAAIRDGAKSTIIFDETNVTSPYNRSNPGINDPCHTIGATNANRTVMATLETVVDFGRTGDRVRMNSQKSVTLTQASGGGGSATGLYLLPEVIQSIVVNDQGGSSINISEDGIAPTLRAQTHGNLPCVITPLNPTAYCIQATTIDRQDHNGANGKGINEDVAYTLNTIDGHAIALIYPINEGAVTGKANGLGIGKAEDPAPTLTASDRHSVVACYTSAAYGAYKDGIGTLRASGGDYGGGSENLIIQIDGTEFAIKYTVRRLTPLECERLQGFPDYWTKYSDTGAILADTPRYTALGNSLAVPCAERVFRGILSAVRGRGNV